MRLEQNAKINFVAKWRGGAEKGRALEMSAPLPFSPFWLKSDRIDNWHNVYQYI
jgi:hypothetical protein